MSSILRWTHWTVWRIFLASATQEQCIQSSMSRIWRWTHWTVRRICILIGLTLISLSFILRHRPTPTITTRLEDRALSFVDLEDFAQYGMDNLSTAVQRESSNSTELIRNSYICPSRPKRLTGKLNAQGIFTVHTWAEIIEQNADISTGGKYVPPDCIARNRVAIIIPLRNRDSQLRVLLSHMHPIWKRQDIQYRVFVITQSGNGIFNRAKLLNAGVAEARKDGDYDCYVFHDVDLLLEDDRCLYWCHEPNPRLVASLVDKFSYVPLSYQAKCRIVEQGHDFFEKTMGSILSGPVITYFGGVSMMAAAQFDEINGLSNLYWGWGGEDDDLFLRLSALGYEVDNPYGQKCSFRMIRHDHESANAENGGRHALLRHASKRMQNEGYSTLRYKVESYNEERLYTNITVDAGHPSKYMTDFISKAAEAWFKCFIEVPWRTSH